MSSSRFLPKFLKHFIVYVIIIGLIMIVSVVLHVWGPPEVIYYDNSWDEVEPFVPQTNVSYNVLLDQHSHTRYSDGKLTVRQSIDWHIAMGFTSMVITDHNTLKNAEEIQQLSQEYKNEIIVIQGMEWTTRRIHLNLIGITHWDWKIPRNPTDFEIKDTIDEVHSQNGVVAVNHLEYTDKVAGDIRPTREQLMNWGVDFIEIINGIDYDEDSYDFWIENNETIGLITGTDMHSPQSSEGGRVNAWTTIYAENFSEAAVMEQLTIHNTSFIINQFGVENLGVHEESVFNNIMRPFYQLGESLVYFSLRNDRSYSVFDRIVVTVFLIYSFGLFVVLEFILLLRRITMIRKVK